MRRLIHSAEVVKEIKQIKIFIFVVLRDIHSIVCTWDLELWSDGCGREAIPRRSRIKTENQENTSRRVQQL